ncbi:hypothetical protein DR950_13545 [Kitasatospora xanthocidica]|uniref:Cellulose synthase n=1 Tax=Kitasatospora xanthocidica TaxID=83382 RepID=A0A372ZRZ0_9ACTN|nr:hypothetical protein [Kitasatospora xanthocidica]RGD58669.1 hypothetical protein DR950_13545 [Kitasatospora xanthocidica]
MLSAAISFILTAGGVAFAGLRAYRRRFLSATRWFAVALLPAGLYLTGLFPLASTIAREFADWATRLVFDPRVWTGIALLGVSAVLLVTTRWVGRRGGTAVESAPERPAAAGPAPERPAVAAPAPKAAKKPAAGKREDGLGDFADIEEILRKRGI